MLSQAEIADMLVYRADGRLLWKHDRDDGRLAGKEAGVIRPNGYIAINVDYQRHLEHRLIFMLHNGYCPPSLDHVNRTKSDNRIENLRPISKTDNLVNCDISRGSSGYRGVSYHRIGKKWQARITVLGRGIHLGLFDTPQEASARYEAAREEHYPGVYI